MRPAVPSQPRVSTVHRTGTYPAWLAMAMVRASASPNGNRNSGSGLLPVAAVICRAASRISRRTAASPGSLGLMALQGTPEDAIGLVRVAC